MSAAGRRVELARGYLLHQRPWRDSSLILELFSAEHGRLCAFARAARGPRTRFSGLQLFRPLLLSWSGRGVAPSLTAAESDGVAPASLPPQSLLSAWYLNELLLKLTVPHDPQPELYEQYALTLARLRAGDALESVLRQFELRLLELLGFGVELDRECGSGRAVQADAYYHFAPGVGVHQLGSDALTSATHGEALSGRLLLMLAAGELPEDAQGQRETRSLLRAALDHCLEGRELRTRTVARAVARMRGAEA
jgi:DNA repair protein RecO (recombination protein O)